MYCKGVWSDSERTSKHHGEPLGFGTLSWDMSELNELTRRLLAEGYTPEDTPPGMQAYKQHEGGWTYEDRKSVV